MCELRARRPGHEWGVYTTAWFEAEGISRVHQVKRSSLSEPLLQPCHLRTFHSHLKTKREVLIEHFDTKKLFIVHVKEESDNLTPKDKIVWANPDWKRAIRWIGVDRFLRAIKEEIRRKWIFLLSHFLTNLSCRFIHENANWATSTVSA